MNDSRIDAYLSKARVAIENGKNVPEIAGKLTLFGYAPEQMEVGQQLLADAEAKQNAQKKEYGEQYDATEKQNTLYGEANKEYMKFMKLARIRFADNVDIQQAMRLNGSRKRNLAGFIRDASLFYSNALANENVINGLSKYNITREDLEKGQQLLKDLEQAEAVQKKETGDAQISTQKRNEAMDKLENWFSEFIEVARIAVDDEPEMMEMLGVLHRSV